MEGFIFNSIEALETKFTRIKIITTSIVLANPPPYELLLSALLFAEKMWKFLSSREREESGNTENFTISIETVAFAVMSNDR
jgi:hypothetical protein